MKPSATITKLMHGSPVRWVALGDSLTYGWMVNKGYLDFLNELLIKKYPAAQLTIFNRGIPGDTAEGGLRRLDDHILSLNPDMVSVQFGLNDLFVGYTLAQFQKNLCSILSRLQQQCTSDILLMTSVPLADRNDNIQAEMFYTAIIETSRQKNLPCALVHTYWKQKIADGAPWHELVQADMVHPTEQGYRLMAEAIMEVL